MVKKNYFICYHPTDLFLSCHFIIHKKLSKKKNILIFDSKILTNPFNLNINDIKLINRCYDRKINIDFIDFGWKNSIKYELNNYLIKKIIRFFYLIKKLKTFNFSENDCFYFGGETLTAITARTIISHLFSKNIKNIFSFGIKNAYRDKNQKISFKATLLSNLLFYFKIPFVKVFVNKQNTIMQKIFIKNFFKKIFLFSNKNKIYKNKELLKLKIYGQNKISLKKKEIIFIDRGVKFLKFYKYYNKEKFIEKMNSILKIISNRYGRKYNLVFKSHPREKRIYFKLYKFKPSYKKNYLEQILEKNRNRIYCIIGITSTGIKISDIYGIKTYSIKNLLGLGDNSRFKKNLINNSNIKTINNFHQLKRF